MLQQFTRLIQVLGLGGILWGVVWSGLAWGSQDLSPLMFVPRQSAWMVSLTQPLNQVSAPVRPVVSEFLAGQWQQLGLGAASEDLLTPQAGLTLINVSPVSTKTPHLVWLIPIRDAATTAKTLAKLWKTLDITPITETIQGIPIFTPGPGTTSPPVAFGMLGNQYLCVSDSVQALREAFMAAQSRNSGLLGASFYREANLTLTPDTWGLSYVNLGAWQHNPEALSPDRLFLRWQNLKKPTPGLGIQTTLITASAEPAATPATPINLQLAKTLPDAAAVILGHDLPGTWAALHDLLAGYGLSQTLFTQISQAWSQPWGINLETEVWPWLTGDFGLAFLPHDPAWHWRLTTPTNPEVTAGLEALNTTLTEQGWARSPLGADPPQTQAWSPNADRPPQFSQTADATWTTLATNATELLNPPNSPPAWQTQFSRTPPDLLIHLDWATYAPAWGETVPMVKLLNFAAPSVFEHLQDLTWLGRGISGRVRQGELRLAWD